MEYEEVETFLPKDFVPKPDPVVAEPVVEDPPTPAAASDVSDSSANESESENKKADMMNRIRGSWRTNRKKRRNDKKKGGSSKKNIIGALFPIRKVDSNATDPRDNTTKAATKKMKEEKVQVKESKGGALPSIREARSGSPANTSATESTSEEQAAAAKDTTSDGSSVVKKDFSIEVGDEHDRFEVGIVPVVPVSKQVEDVFDEATEVPVKSTEDKEVYVEDKSKALVPVDSTTVSSADGSDAAAVKDAQPENNQLVVQKSSEKRKWVKNVSLSIGGYKTSFQFSDPMANLADTVNDALNVVGDDAALVEEAKALDEIGEKLEEERDYDVNPTKLFMYLQQRAWGLALNQLKKNPDEAKVWVYRKTSQKQAANMEEGETSQTLVVAGEASTEIKLRWKLLPLHACIVLGAPSEIITEIIRAHPNAARKPDERGSLPVHLAASRLDVDPDGEKVVLQLFGAFPDSIEIQDRKGRTPPELAKLARMRKEAEEKRKSAAEEDAVGIEKTVSTCNNEAEEEDGDGNVSDDCSVKSSMSARFKMMLKKSKSTDTVDRRKKSKKKKKSNVAPLVKSKSDDVEVDKMGPGFTILNPSKSTEERTKAITASRVDVVEDDDDDEATIVTMPAITGDYELPQGAPSASVGEAVAIPLPGSFADDEASVRSKKSKSPTAEAISLEDDEATVVETQKEPLRALLEKAAENAGRGGLDVTEFLNDLEAEWVTDVEALRRIDGETMDCILPVVLSREVQRLMNKADRIDNAYFSEDAENPARKRSFRKTKSSNKRMPRRSKKGLEKRAAAAKAKATPKDALSMINEENSVGDDAYLSILTEGMTVCKPNCDDDLSVVTEARTVCSRANSAVRINEVPTECMDTSDIDEELETRKIHASLIADARKKFPTRESLEDAIRERQVEVKVAVRSGFDVDKQTLSRAALADDEVRRLLPLRMILPSLDDLTEMIGVLQVHKESALRNMNLKKAVGIQTEIDEVQEQIDAEKNYILQKKISDSKCVSCGEVFAPEKKMVGILKTKEHNCTKCRVGSIVQSVNSVGSSEGSVASKCTKQTV